MPNEFTVIICTPVSGTIGCIHINTLRDGRGDTAIEAALDGMQWIKENTHYTYVVAYIPTKYMNVIRFSEKVGFMKNLFIPNSYVKDGVMYDMVMMHRSL
jgi:hypothetical protein